MIQVLKNLFGNATKKDQKTFSKKRGLRLEPLEERQMLSVTVGNLATLHAEAVTRYGDVFGDVSNYSSALVVDLEQIDADSFADLTKALAYANAGRYQTNGQFLHNADGQNTNDLIVLTSTDPTFDGSVDLGTTYGQIANFAAGNGVTIVWLGGEADADGNFPLLSVKMKADKNERVFSIRDNAGDVILAGLDISGGNVTTTDSYGTIGGGIYSQSNTNLTVVGSNIHDNQANNFGGGIYSTGSNLTIIDSVIDNNTTGGQGGGIAIIGGTNKLTLKDTIVSNNHAELYGAIGDPGIGGGLYAYSTGTVDGTTVTTLSSFDITITDSEFFGNDALGSEGGAIAVGRYLKNADGTNLATPNANAPTAKLNITGTDIYDNHVIYDGTTVAKGGGIFNVATDMSLTDVQIYENTVENARIGASSSGAGLYVENAKLYAKAAISIVDSKIFDNTAQAESRGYSSGGGATLKGDVSLSNVEIVGNTADSGAGLFLSLHGDTRANTTMKLDRLTVRDNMAIAGMGGGIYADISVAANLDITNSLIVDNEASENGGGLIFTGSGTAAINLKNLTVAGNTAVIGGGIYTARSLNIYNSIIAENTADTASDDLYIDAGATVTSQYTIYGTGSYDAGTQTFADFGPGTFLGNGVEYDGRVYNSNIFTSTNTLPGVGIDGPVTNGSNGGSLGKENRNVFNYITDVNGDPTGGIDNLFTQKAIVWVPVKITVTVQGQDPTLYDKYVDNTDAEVFYYKNGSVYYKVFDNTSTTLADGDVTALGEWKPWKTGDAGTPVYVHDNYRPKATSWAIDSGRTQLSTGAGTKDLVGTDRVVNTVDRGAYEATVDAKIEFVSVPEVVWPGMTFDISFKATNVGMYATGGSTYVLKAYDSKGNELVISGLPVSKNIGSLSTSGTYLSRTQNLSGLTLAGLGFDGEIGTVYFTVELVLPGDSNLDDNIATTKPKAASDNLTYVGPVFDTIAAPAQDTVNANRYSTTVSFSEPVSYDAAKDSIQLWGDKIEGATTWTRYENVTFYVEPVGAVNGLAKTYKISWAKADTQNVSAEEFHLVVYSDAFADADGKPVKGQNLETSGTKAGNYRVHAAWKPTAGNSYWQNTSPTNVNTNADLNFGNTSHTFTPGSTNPALQCDYVVLPSDGITNDINSFTIEIWNGTTKNWIKGGAGVEIAMMYGKVTISADGQSFTYTWNGKTFGVDEVFYRYVTNTGQALDHFYDVDADGKYTEGVDQWDKLDNTHYDPARPGASVHIVIGGDFATTNEIIVTTLKDELDLVDGALAPITAGTGLSLREALDYAKYIDGAVIKFGNAYMTANGYTVGQSLAGGTSRLAMGELVITTDVTIEGSDQTLHGVGFSRIMSIGKTASPIIDVTMSGLTISNGVVANSSNFGAGIYALNTNLTLDDMIFEGNAGSSRGGGLYLNSGNLKVTDSEFNYNNSVFGAGIYVQGTAGNHVIENVTFTGNYASSGAGLYQYDGKVTVNDSDFLNNNVYSGGGGFTQRAGEVTFKGSKFMGNTAINAGGAMDLAGSKVDILETVFERNTAYQGGAINQSGTGVSKLDGVVFNKNLATATKSLTRGGAMSISGDVKTTLTNTVFNDNRSTYDTTAYGGAFFVGGTGNIATFGTGVVFNNNSAIRGGAIAATAGNVVVADEVTFNENRAQYGGGVYLQGNGTHTFGVAVFNSNYANEGGGIYQYDGSLTLSGTEFKNNTGVNYGGGLLVAGRPVLTQLNAGVSFTGNTSGRGAGIDFYAPNATVAATYEVKIDKDVTFTGNTSSATEADALFVEKGRKVNVMDGANIHATIFADLANELLDDTDWLGLTN